MVNGILFDNFHKIFGSVLLCLIIALSKKRGSKKIALSIEKAILVD